MNQDFLAIGDIMSDTFIRLIDSEASVACDERGEHCQLSMPFPEKLPYEYMHSVSAVGNAANAAVSAARLGLKSAFVTWVGNDEGGEACKKALDKNGVSTDFVTVEEGKATNNHYVLWYGPDRTILIKHESFDYALPSNLPAPRGVYLSSVGVAGMGIHEPLADWLAAHPDTKLAFQPGTFQIEAGIEKLARIYARTDVFFANKEEYQRILGTDEEEVKKLMEMMREKGPKVAFLTDGPLGAYALSIDGAWKIGLYPDPRKAFERTGAGDAFSSTAMVALLEGKSVPEALTWGPVNSMSVVQKIGAQEGLLTRDALLAYLAEAPQYIAEPL